MDIVEEFADSYGSRSVRILTPAATNEHRRRADTIGVRIEKAPSTIDAWIVDLHLALEEDAYVFLNGAGIAGNYVASVVKALQCAKLRRAVWLIHEDRSRLPSSRLLSPTQNSLPVSVRSPRPSGCATRAIESPEVGI